MRANEVISLSTIKLFWGLIFWVQKSRVKDDEKLVAKSGGCEQKYGIARSKCVLLHIEVIRVLSPPDRLNDFFDLFFGREFAFQTVEIRTAANFELFSHGLQPAHLITLSVMQIGAIVVGESMHRGRKPFFR